MFEVDLGLLQNGSSERKHHFEANLMEAMGQRKQWKQWKNGRWKQWKKMEAMEE